MTSDDFPTLELTAAELWVEHGCILPADLKVGDEIHFTTGGTVPMVPVGLIVTRSESIPGTWTQGRWVDFSRARLGPEEE